MRKRPTKGPVSTEDAITFLMSRPDIKNAKLHPEQLICIDFADRMRRHTAQKRFKGVWCHVPNEGARSRIFGAVMRAMGLITGSTDFYFLWNGGGCVIEFKVPERMGFRSGMYVKIKQTEQSAYQGYFQQWCEDCGIPYYLCFSPEEAEGKLRALGALL